MNTLREFIHPYKAKKAGNSTYPILSITKDYGIVLQDEKFKKRIASVDTSSYKIVPRGLIVQGIHIDERNFGVQDLVEEGIVSPAYKLWSVNVDRADPYVVAYAMRSDYLTDYIESKFRGSIRRREHITDNDLLDAPANIPSMKHQKIFLEFVKQAEKSKTICKQIFQSLDNLVKSRFIEMFGNLDTNPFEWETGHIADVISSVKYGTSKPATSDGKYKYLRMSNITDDGHLDLSDLKTIDVDDSEFEKYVVRNGDVLFNRTNSGDKVGKTCVFNSNEPMIIAGYIIRVRVNERCTPGYLSAYLNSKYGKICLMRVTKDSVCQSNINAKELQSIDILIPPKKVQEEYDRFVKQVDKSKFVETVEPDHPAVFQNVHGFPSFGLIST
ncbi:restriction endonuclease subunit S [Methanomethylophilus alvi]|uniref:restriction endonuclease subunit S n=1 Tax=Methanomethylophilus alvi TaxID=1291540 RepID=UPI0037DC4867